MAHKRFREDDATIEDSGPAEEVGHTPKYASLEPEEERHQKTMQCSLPPHKALLFASYPDFEAHYIQSHTNRCRECQKNFPSSHFLDLHLSEHHDPIVATKRDKGEKTYGCFVEGCDKICSDWKKRRSHLVDKHGFPRNYDFFIVNSGIDGRRSMLRAGIDENGHRRSSRERGRRDSSATTATQTTDATSVSFATGSVVLEENEGERPKVLPTRSEVANIRGEGLAGNATASNAMPAKGKEVTMDDITKSMSSLQFVPRSVTFGRRKGKGFAKS